MQSQTPGTEIHTENYRLIQEHVYSQAGIVLDGDKHYLLENRLTPIVRTLGLNSINDLCALLRATGETGVGRQIAEAMTTNETYFFRDPAQYEAIKSILLPRLREEKIGTKRLRFWSAAASTGQEAYSLAMLLLEQQFGSWDTQILCTDFSSQVLERARGGKYRQIEMNRGLPAELMVKYFDRSGMDWEVKSTVRQMTRFEPIDLRKSMRSLGPFDLVFCRNVMIYFDTETKRKILQEIHGTLFRGGWLLLGGAEVTSDADAWFGKKIVGNVTVYVAR